MIYEITVFENLRFRPFTRKRKAEFSKVSSLESFLKMHFLWPFSRVRVDGRPKHRKKSPFSKKKGYVRTRPIYTNKHINPLLAHSNEQLSDRVFHTAKKLHYRTVSALTILGCVQPPLPSGKSLSQWERVALDSLRLSIPSPRKSVCSPSPSILSL